MRAMIPLLWLVACNYDFADPTREAGPPLEEGRSYPTVVHEPTAFGVLTRSIVKEGSEREVPAGTACTACHAPTPEQTWDLPPGEEFHTDVTVEHGDLSCGQCHDKRDRSSLLLADGTKVAPLDVMTLCSQCHGSQARDYEHGAHGGMSGHWDLQRGPRTRNNCVDCHAPHSPDFESVLPVFPPRDRYLGSE